MKLCKIITFLRYVQNVCMTRLCSIHNPYIQTSVESYFE